MSAANSAAAGAILLLHAWSFIAVPPLQLNVVATATALVFLGASRSLKLLKEPPGRAGAKSAAAPREETVCLTARDAATFPLVGSVALCGCYAMIKIFGKALLNTLLLAYFVCLGLVAVETAAESAFLKGKQTPRFGKVIKLWKPAAWVFEQAALDLRVSGPQAACWACAVAAVAAYAATRFWMLNNLIAACLCVSGLEMVSVGSFRNAAVLLCGLFVYDITWVFGTDVMVTVAKGIDGPIKLLFRRELKPDDDPSKAFSMLGLGDIVVPGLFVALILRFDATRAGARRGAEVGDFASPVFLAVLASYAGGLVLTLYIMTVFDAAQPALLYLVPATLLTSLLVAACRGEASTLAAFSEEEENDAPPSAGPGKSNGGATTPRRSPRLAAKSPSKEN
mmetsp:Transcript_3613/g.11182  ORF Transcript_3613/g.11182 Transcript_3613/m.11182 type:complete len:395 (+) Transcript_3613:608-1792(+)